MSYLGPSLRRSSRRTQRPWRRTLVAIALSLAVNALILTRLDVSWLAKPQKTAPVRDVALAPLTAKEWAANRAIGSQSSQRARPQPLAAVQPKPPPPPPRSVPGQVVDVAPSKNNTPPKDSRFVSEQNNTVEKETRSRYAKSGYENTLPTPSSPKNPAQKSASPPAPKPPPGETKVARAERKPGKAGAPGPPGRTLPSEAPRQRLALIPGGELRNPLQTPPVQEQRSGEGGQAGGGGDKGATSSGPLARLDLRPSAADYDRIAGGPAPDHLEGVEEGDGTYLNTREWKYAGYFNRIKQAVASMWDPGASLTARDPSGARFGGKDWQTLLSIRLDASGALKNVSVARSSGLDFLDRTAIDAFQKAQPFNNPPPGLADDHGEIAFTFGFYVQTSGSGMRIFR